MVYQIMCLTKSSYLYNRFAVILFYKDDAFFAWFSEYYNDLTTL